MQEHLARARALVEAHDAAAAVEEDDLSCRVCMDGEGSHAFVPCGHRCVCESCAAHFMSGTRKCPICNSDSTQTMRVYDTYH